MKFGKLVRSEIEDTCEKMVKEYRKKGTNSAAHSKKVKELLYKFSRHIMNNPQKFIDLNGKCVFVLGAARNAGSQDSFGVSMVTYDFQWFTKAMNEFLNVDKEPLNAWEFVFDKEGHIGAKALSDKEVLKLKPKDLALLRRLGFRLPSKNDANDGSLTSLSSGDRATETRKDPLMEAVRQQEATVSHSLYKIRKICRRLRLSGGLLDSTRRKKSDVLLDRIHEKFDALQERMANVLGEAPAEDEVECVEIEMSDEHEGEHDRRTKKEDDVIDVTVIIDDSEEKNNVEPELIDLLSITSGHTSSESEDEGGIRKNRRRVANLEEDDHDRPATSGFKILEIVARS